MCELLRLRQEIILAAAETATLAQVYKQQCEMVSERNYKVLLEEGISFTEENDS